MSAQKRKAILLGLLGLVLIIFGIKYIPVFLAGASQQSEIMDKPVILFINVDEPCECMVELTQRAEDQMANWPVEQRGGIPVVRIAFDMRKDLQAKYSAFRAPCLVLVDEQDQIAWRQDYPLIEGGPFDLEELEAAIAELGRK
jgi:hypothetical protein